MDVILGGMCTGKTSLEKKNTKYVDLYYYHLKSRSGIDLSISKALDKKKKFNEKKFANWD